MTVVLLTSIIFLLIIIVYVVYSMVDVTSKSTRGLYVFLILSCSFCIAIANHIMTRHKRCCWSKNIILIYFTITQCFVFMAFLGIGTVSSILLNRLSLFPALCNVNVDLCFSSIVCGIGGIVLSFLILGHTSFVCFRIVRFYKSTQSQTTSTKQKEMEQQQLSSSYNDGKYEQT